jgi:hypothetical protein
VGLRVAEELVRTGPGSGQRLRVDLHGVSATSADGERTAIRWEWIEHIDAADGVDVRSARASVHLPPGAFGSSSQRLGALLEEARAVDRRPDVIAELDAGGMNST